MKYLAHAAAIASNVFWLTVMYYLQMRMSFGGSRVHQSTEEREHSCTLHSEGNLKLQEQQSDVHTVRSYLTTCEVQLQQLGHQVTSLRAERTALSNRLMHSLQEIDNCNNSKSSSDQQEIQLLNGTYSVIIPGVYYERITTKLAADIRSIWYDLNEESSYQNSTCDKEEMLNIVSNKHRSLMVELRALAGEDRSRSWKEKELASLQDLVQRRLDFLQNPANCSSAKKLVYQFHTGCGYSCIVHHLVYSLMMAYGTQRTLIQESTGWSYKPGGWDTIYQPLSRTCAGVPNGQRIVLWKNETESFDKQVVRVQGTLTKNRPQYEPLSIPEDLAPRLRLLTADPAAWFVGQLTKYILRPQPHLQAYLDNAKTELGFMNPIVGIQVRRTDKLLHEAKFYDLAQYMRQVEAWYLTRQDAFSAVQTRRVFIASDDPTVMEEAQQKYSQYEFIGKLPTVGPIGPAGYSEASLFDVVRDLYLLSLCDFVICTYSSNLCRLIFEMKQSTELDAARSVHSLDYKYWFHHQRPEEEVVISEHIKTKGTSEIDLQPGDEVIVSQTKNPAIDGYSRGTNKRTKTTGLYPWYKTQRKLVIIPYPVYPEVRENTIFS